MEPSIEIKTITSVLVIGFALACVALPPRAQAVSPPPDGGYAGNNTAEGTSALFSLTSGIDNTALGFQALLHNNTGNSNTAGGFRALFANTNGHQNTATGVSALISNTTGDFNTANGANALNHNIDGGNNTATGAQALFSNTSGNFNTATGVAALFHNTIGYNNCAFGANALFSNNTGAYNTAFGWSALQSNTAGYSNTAIGVGTLANNTGNLNTAVGVSALVRNRDGMLNTATGASALASNANGNNNTAMGHHALLNNDTGGNNTAVGVGALGANTAGGANTAIGSGAGQNVTTGSFNVYIGTNVAGVAGEVGHTYISNITSTQQNLSPVTVDLATGLLGHEFSSQRYKEDIKPMANASEALYSLKPVTYRYKKEIDKNQALDYGLVAEEVAKVDPRLAVRDGKGQIESVRYNAINAMLLNEFLKEHQRVEALQATITQVESTVRKHEATIAQQQKDFQCALAEQKKHIQALTTGLQKVTARIEASRSAPKVVVNQP